MKLSSSRDAWRDLATKVPPFRLEHLELSGAVLLPAVISFAPRLTLLCGANGVGKTTVLRALELALLEASHPRVQSRLDSAQIGLQFFARGAKRQISAKFASGVERDGDVSFVPETMFLDPAEQAVSLSKLFDDMSNIDELLEQYTAAEYDKELMEWSRYITGKPYTSCSVYEIEDLSDEVVPYFVATCGSVSYGTPDMGRGELAIHLMLWAIRRARANSVLLLEEPESHITPRAQKALMNVLAQVCVDRAVCIIATTHSTWTLVNTPKEMVRLLYYHDDALHLQDAPGREALEDALGVSARKSGVILVEDIVAQLHVLAILRRLDSGLLRRAEVLYASGASGLEQALNFPKSDRAFKIVGIFDGDQRATRSKEDYVWPKFFLDGDGGPETYLWPALLSNADRAADLLGIESSATLRGTLAAVAGENPHDQFTELRKALGCSLEQIVGVATRLWLESDDSSALELIGRLRDAVDS